MYNIKYKGHKHYLELVYSKHSVLKNCIQPNMTINTLTVIFQNNPAQFI